MTWDDYVDCANALLEKVAEGVSIDPARGTDYGAAVKWWIDERGALHLQDVQLIEPPKATLETRLVLGSEPPRYEPL